MTTRSAPRRPPTKRAPASPWTSLATAMTRAGSDDRRGSMSKQTKVNRWRDASIADVVRSWGRVTEVPPIEGRSYVGYTVHPQRPRFTVDGSSGPVAVAIAHYDDD